MTLVVGYTDIQREFGRYLSIGRDPDNWTAQEDTDFEDCLRDGINQFITAGGHKWYFLRPIRTVVLWATATITLSGTPSYSSPSSTLTAATGTFYATMVGKSVVFETSGNSYTINEYVSSTSVKVTGDASSEASGEDITITADGNYQLPSSFGGLSDPIYFTDTQNVTYGPVELVSPNMVLNARSRVSSTNRPVEVALAPIELDQSVGVRHMLMAHPTPDSTYTMQYQGRLTPEQLSEALPYLVTPPYTRALLESVLSIAETTYRENETLHKNLYQQALAEAIAHDNTYFAPKNLGLNIDRYAQQWGNIAPSGRRDAYVRVNGIIPGVD